MREASTCGGRGGRTPIARISTRIGYDGKSPALHVPHVGGDRAAGLHHPNHFSDAFGRVGNEHDHQRHGSGIEAARSERKGHGVALAKLRLPAREARTRKGELPVGGVDALYLCRGAGSTSSSVKAPFPHPTSIQRKPRAGASQSRKTSPADRLHMPIICS